MVVGAVAGRPVLGEIVAETLGIFTGVELDAFIVVGCVTVEGSEFCVAICAQESCGVGFVVRFDKTFGFSDVSMETSALEDGREPTGTGALLVAAGNLI
jgi:hypothetical protein